jgi:hypothetical protein
MSETMCIRRVTDIVEHEYPHSWCGRVFRGTQPPLFYGLDGFTRNMDARATGRSYSVTGPCPACIRAAVAALEGAGVESAADARKRHGFAPLSEEQQEANLQANLDDLEQSGEGGK